MTKKQVPFNHFLTDQSRIKSQETKYVREKLENIEFIMFF